MGHCKSLLHCVGAMLGGMSVALQFLGSRAGVSVARLPSPLEEGEATKAVPGDQGLSWKPFGASPLKGLSVFKTAFYKEGQSL